MSKIYIFLLRDSYISGEPDEILFATTSKDMLLNRIIKEIKTEHMRYGSPYTKIEDQINQLTNDFDFGISIEKINDSLTCGYIMAVNDGESIQ